tara:strand:- start:20530 stop:21012 length:483 start_codon:yes stop_codon:yes gene_type:complete
MNVKKFKMTKRRKRAEKWFAAHGINPNTPNSDGNAQVLDMKPAITFTEDMDGTTTYPCEISIEGFLFYAHVTVSFTDSAGKTYEFEGGSGGIGVGDLSSAGVIYFGNEETLLKATTFGVAFGAEDGGVVQVTWGTSGNATAAGVGEGLGAFGGSGSWKQV